MRLDLVVALHLIVEERIGKLLPLTCEGDRPGNKQTRATIDQNILGSLIQRHHKTSLLQARVGQKRKATGAPGALKIRTLIAPRESFYV
jgi:hypothetical protein